MCTGHREVSDCDAASTSSAFPPHQPIEPITTVSNRLQQNVYLFCQKTVRISSRIFLLFLIVCTFTSSSLSATAESINEQTGGRTRNLWRVSTDGIARVGARGHQPHQHASQPLSSQSTQLPSFITSSSSFSSSSSSSKVSKNSPPQRHMKRLYDDLFQDYEKDIRPVLNDSEPLTITIQFWLKQILKVDERDQTIKCYLWLELYWTDELLKWNPADYGGLDQIHVPSHKIWRPDVLVYNNAQLNVQENELETQSMVTNRGEVTLFRAMINDITCTLSLSLFPFDQQICFLTFASWSMDGSKLLLLPANNSDNLALYIRNTEWTLTDFSVKLYEKMYDCCTYPFPDLTFFFVLKRSPSYYIFTLIIPSTCITVVTIVGFFTPHSTTGENTEKVSLGVNALLSMSIIMMMVSGEVPATSEVIPLIGKYYIGLIFLIFGAAFTTTITLAFQMRGNSGTPMSPRMKYIIFEKIGRSPLGAWFFAVQIGRKHKFSNRSKGGPKNKENNTYIFDNICVNKPGTTEYDGIISNSINSNSMPTSNGIKLKMRNSSSTTANDAKLAKIVQMNELTGDLASIHKNSSVGLDTNHLLMNNISNTHHHLSDRVNQCLESIEESIVKTHHQRNIEFEWEMAARIVERIIMIIFITLTVLFAFFMLGGASEEIRLNDEIMDRVKK